MDKRLLDWAVREMGYVPVDASNQDSLRKLCTGSLHKHWDYITKHVRSKAQVKHIKNNLKLFTRKSTDASKSSLSLTKFEDTLNERDLLIKELKEIQFLSAKCKEKCAKVNAEVSATIQDCAEIRKTLGTKRDAVQTDFQTLKFLDLLGDEYTNNGKLRKTAQNIDKLAALNSAFSINGDVRKPVAFEKLLSSATVSLRAALLHEGLASKIDSKLVAQCVAECGNNPTVLRDLLIQKGRLLSQRITQIDVVNSTDDYRAQNALNEWRKAHVEAINEIEILNKDIKEVEKMALVASENAKRAIDENCNDKKDKVLRVLVLLEKKCRINAILAELESNLSNNKQQEDFTQKMAELESLKAKLSSQNQTVKLLYSRNFGFKQKLAKMQDMIAKMVKNEVTVLARRVSEELSSRSRTVVANRLANFKLSPTILTLNTNQAFDRNAAICLKKIADDKRKLFEFVEFLRKAEKIDRTGSNYETVFKILLEKANTNPLEDLPEQLDCILAKLK